MGHVRIDVPDPGEHPHAEQMEMFLFLLGAFGALSLALGALLVATMVHALLAGQARQIGIMKAIGASTGQIAAMTLAHVAVLAGVSLLLGVPLGIQAGRGYVRFAANMLNLDIASEALPAGILSLQILVGVLVPLAASIVPIVNASRMSVIEALASDRGGAAPFGSRPFDRRLAGLGWVPRPLRLTLRTTFRRRGRLALTVGMLAAGGGAFVAALNTSGAWTRAIDRDARTRRYDLDVRLSRPTSIPTASAALGSVSDVTHSEAWTESGASIVGADGAERARVAVVGPLPGTTLLAPRIREGRFLAPGDEHALVVNQALLVRDPSVRLGSTLALRARGRTLRGTVVGIVDELYPVPIAYAPEPAVRSLTEMEDGTTRLLRLVTRAHDAEAQSRAARAVEAALERAGIGVDAVHALADRRKSLEDHLVIILSALVLAASLVVLVGGVGLSSALALGVVERTREIGILGAIGATPRVIARDVVLEGIVIGVMSWCVALVLAVPLTILLGSVTGNMFFRSPLGFYMSPAAAGGWLVLVVVLASVASALPAWRASRLEISEALAHV